MYLSLCGRGVFPTNLTLPKMPIPSPKYFQPVKGIFQRSVSAPFFSPSIPKHHFHHKVLAHSRRANSAHRQVRHWVREDAVVQ